MKKEKFVFNDKTLSYEPVKVPIHKRILRGLLYMFLAFLGMFVFDHYIMADKLSPKEQNLKRELDQIKYHYSVLNEQMELMASDLNQIHQRGNNIQTLIFGAKPLDEGEWLAGIGGAERYKNVVKYSSTGNLLIGTLSKADQLKRQMELQLEALAQLESLAKEKEDRLESIPSLKPVAETDVTKDLDMLSGFGMRMHPVHKIVRMHTGIDFPAPTGTNIRAAGSGVVVKVEKHGGGYGRYVVIDHGYDYQSLYAHMNSYNVRVGQEVKKGQVIGTVGSTGTSTAPHLHYEVRFKNNPIDPIDFCMDGLTPDEYARLVKAASIPNKSFD
jgi:murein DD-endopeptidase MepM/ murein hydrolase activator NlpD